MTEPGSQQATFVYDALHRRTQTNYPNGVSLFFTYDQSNRQTRVLGQKPASGQVLTDYTYSWQKTTGEDTGLRQRVTDKDGNTTTYTYDVLNRLTQALTPQQTYAYNYDANSNRTSQTINGVTTNYTHNSADQLTAAGSTTFSYDGNGNETSTSAGRQWAYNAKDQAASVTPPGGTPISMSYAGRGQFKRVNAGSTQFTTTGLGLSREDGTSYVRDDDGKLLSMRSGSTSHYYLLDGLGSVAALTDGSGSVVSTYTYEPFGQLASSTGTISNAYRWLGGLGVYHDATIGLYKMGTRYYDPVLGRFTQVDPISGGSANPYDYAFQDPINRFDADGLASIGGFFNRLKRWCATQLLCPEAMTLKFRWNTERCATGAIESFALTGYGKFWLWLLTVAKVSPTGLTTSVVLGCTSHGVSINGKEFPLPFP